MIGVKNKQSGLAAAVAALFDPPEHDPAAALRRRWPALRSAIRIESTRAGLKGRESGGPLTE